MSELTRAVGEPNPLPAMGVLGSVPHSRRQFLRGLALLGGLCWLGSGGVLRGQSGDVITYRIQSGDTLGGIARQFGCSVADLRRLNNIQGDRIYAGRTLRVPAGPAVVELEEVRRLNRMIAVDRNRWRIIVGHHSAIERGNAVIYDRNHRRRGMVNGLAYHFVIGNGVDSGDGEIEISPRWRAQHQGGHVRDAHTNEHGIGICLVGNFEERRPSTRQLAAFVALIEHLQRDVLGRSCRFAVHREIDGPRHTLCPGRLFPTAEMHRRFG